MRKGILLACACVLCLSACGTGTKEQSKNPQKALEVGVETTPKSVEATSSPMVQKIKNTSGKRENPKDLKQIKVATLLLNYLIETQKRDLEHLQMI